MRLRKGEKGQTRSFQKTTWEMTVRTGGKNVYSGKHTCLNANEKDRTCPFILVLRKTDSQRVIEQRGGENEYRKGSVRKLILRGQEERYIAGKNRMTEERL